jgi:proteic killer suppression protein
MCVLKSFKGKETEKVFARQRLHKLPSDIQQVALRKLRVLNNAATLGDLRGPPANRLEKLAGDRAGSAASASTTDGASASCGASGMLTM